MASGDEQYLQLLQQLIELQQQNNELCSGGDTLNRSHAKKPERPLVEYGFTESD